MWSLFGSQTLISVQAVMEPDFIPSEAMAAADDAYARGMNKSGPAAANASVAAPYLRSYREDRREEVVRNLRRAESHVRGDALRSDRPHRLSIYLEGHVRSDALRSDRTHLPLALSVDCGRLEARLSI
jgi:hypothetical protein